MTHEDVRHTTIGDRSMCSGFERRSSELLTGGRYWIPTQGDDEKVREAALVNLTTSADNPWHPRPRVRSLSHHRSGTLSNGARERSWTETSLDELVRDVRGGDHRHIALVAGSATSLGMPSDCLGVPQIRRAVLDGIREAATSTSPTGLASRSLLSRMSADARLADPELCARVNDLPFEQFLGCLGASSEDTATQIVTAICGSTRSNSNHDSLARIAQSLIDRTVAQRVSIVTTNYDLCIDHALAQTFGHHAVTRHTQLGLPSYEVQLTDGKRVRYVKVHGCISEPLTLVFTFAQMMSLLISDDWAVELSDWLTDSGRYRPTLVIFVGYGFWDPDLRDWMRDLFAGASLYRNEKRMPIGQSDAVHVPSSGTAQLQNEFFGDLRRAGCTMAMVRSDLVASGPASDGDHNVLTKLNEELTGELLPIPELALVNESDRLRAAFSDWDDIRVVHFLSRLLHASNRPDGGTLFFDAMLADAPGSRQLDFAHAYLRTFGTENNWSGGTTACHRLRQRRLSRDINAVAWGYQSFTSTLDQHKGVISRAANGGWCVMRGALLRPFVSDQSRAIFREYSSHYRTKGIQTLWQISGRSRITRASQPVLRLMARWQANSMRRQLNQLLAARDLDVYGDATALLAELAILSGDRDRALDEARRSRVFRTIVGRISNAIQGERLVGWAFLAQGTNTGKIAAIHAFARGFALSMQLREEPSVSRKLGANLLRLALSGPWQHFQPNRVAPSDDEVHGACDVLLASLAPGADSSELAEAWQLIAEQVLCLFAPNEASLLDELGRFADWRRYPMYLPMCEPSGDNENAQRPTMAEESN